MGASSSKVSVEALIERYKSESSSSPAVDHLPSLAREDVVARLTDLGITASDTDSDESLKQALAVAENGEFWCRNSDLHPNGKRIRFWLWVHGKYRQYCSQLLEKVESLSSATSNDRATLAKPVLEAYLKFTKKIGNHTHFEDTQLFKYFEEHGKGKVKFDEL